MGTADTVAVNPVSRHLQALPVKLGPDCNSTSAYANNIRPGGGLAKCAGLW